MSAPMSVTAIIVTRGDQDLEPVVASLPEEWEVVIWDNGVPSVKVYGVCEFTLPSIKDLSVYGRYAAIKHASHDLIYVQDDDCIVSDPQAIARTWLAGANHSVDGEVLNGAATWGPAEHPRGGDVVVCNMPAAFRARHFYDEHSLVGFGAAFHRDAPERAFAKFRDAIWADEELARETDDFASYDTISRTCDIIFTALTPRVLVDVEYEDMPWASADNRMWKQPDHQGSRQQMLDLVLMVRDVR